MRISGSRGAPSFVGRARVELDADSITLSFDLAGIVTLQVWDVDSVALKRTTAFVLQPAFEHATRRRGPF
jgi:hypothetical protein